MAAGGRQVSNPTCLTSPICFDGAPWGFGIWDFASGTPHHIYKGFQLPTDFQIRAYDLNQVSIDDQDLSTAYLPGNSANKDVVLANIWAYEPGCTVKCMKTDASLP